MWALTTGTQAIYLLIFQPRTRAALKQCSNASDVVWPSEIADRETRSSRNSHSRPAPRRPQQGRAIFDSRRWPVPTERCLRRSKSDANGAGAHDTPSAKRTARARGRGSAAPAPGRAAGSPGRAVAPGLAGPALLRTPRWGRGRDIRHACRLGLEGIVAKRKASTYRHGRCQNWRKVLNRAYERRGEPTRPWRSP